MPLLLVAEVVIVGAINGVARGLSGGGVKLTAVEKRGCGTRAIVVPAYDAVEYIGRELVMAGTKGWVIEVE